MKKIISIAMLLSAIFVLSACGEKELQKHSKVFYDTFDTSITYLAYTESESEFEDQATFVESEFRRLHDIFNGYNPGVDHTNVYDLNSKAGQGPVQVDQELFDLLKFSKDNYEKTDGKLNIAMGAVTSLWTQARNQNVDMEEADIIIPSDEDLQAANQHTNIDDLILDEANLTVELRDPEMSLDVGAVAKGYATELVAKELMEKGITHASINAGGNVRTIGTPGDGREKWGLAIQNPDLSASDYLEVLFIGQTSLVTSGDYQRYFEKDGVRYHHIIDPETLKPKSLYNSVSIITEDSGIADFLSTSIFLSTKEEAEEILKNYPGAEVLWYSEAEGKTNTPGLDQYMQSKGAKSE